MPSRSAKCARVLGILLLGGFVCQPVLAQRGRAQGRKKNPPATQNLNPQPGKANPGPNGANQPGKQPGKQPEENGPRGLKGLPGPWMERLRSLPPQAQERFMQNNERFKNLPPGQQQEIRRRLERWNSLTPQQQQRMLENERKLEQMTPEQRRYIRQELMPRWQELPPARKLAIRRHLNALSGLSDAEREAKLNNPDFMRGLSPDEQKMLRDLSSLRVGPGSDPGGDPPS